tara:strand:- start:66 stop:455 length:390 start_codon:yes stop_codon:yes gene_type:complete
MKKTKFIKSPKKNVKAAKRGKPKAVKAAKPKEIKENIPDTHVTHVISENIISAASIEEAMEKPYVPDNVRFGWPDSSSSKNIEYTDKEQTQIKATKATEDETYADLYLAIICIVCMLLVLCVMLCMQEF